jgi:hypothetical protein
MNKDAGDEPSSGRGGTAGTSAGGASGGHAAGSSGHAAGTGGSSGHAAGAGGTAAKRELPRVYPLVRASTPTELIMNEMFEAQAFMLPPDSGIGVLPQGLGGEITLALAVQERFYSMGPTELLRIVKDLDDRIAGLDTDPSKHACLTATPVDHTYTFPNGQTFEVQLQCLQNFGAPGSAGAGWVAFGFGTAAPASTDDAGASDADGGTATDGEAFYLVEGQEGGMGGAYRVQGDDVEAWIAVADSTAPTNSRVLMHLVTHKSPATSELALAGAAVGFCSAHLKTSSNFLYIEGRTNAVPPPGAPMTGQYCDALRAGCFAVSDLNTDLGSGDVGCQGIAPPSFAIHGTLDASTDPGANVVPNNIYMYFNQRLTGVAEF